MANKFLDSTGINYLWGKMKTWVTAQGYKTTDTNTWRPVVNNLTSTATDQSLSAAQGKALNDKFANYLPKTTYEYNKEIAFGSTGKLYIGAFPMYDSNITVEISATTSTTYNATLVIATQNINTTGGGSLTATVYGDATNTIAPNIYIGYASGSNQIHVYFSPQSWSKNLIHIQAVALAGAPSNVCTSVDSIPSTANRKPTNALTANFQLKGDYLTSITKSMVTTALGYTPPTMDTQNTVGSINKANTTLYLVGVSGGASNTPKESNINTNCYIGSDNCLYSNGSKVLTSHQSLSGYATQTWVEGKGYITKTTADGIYQAKGTYLTSLPARLATAGGSGTGYADPNSAIEQGWHYITQTSASRPPFKQVDGVTGNDYRVMTTAYGSTWLQQIATDYRSNDIFTRRLQNGVWQGWTALVKMQQGLASPVGTNNAIARWDSSRNATIKDSKVTIDDNGVLNAPTLKENGTSLSDKYQAKGSGGSGMATVAYDVELTSGDSIDLKPYINEGYKIFKGFIQTNDQVDETITISVNRNSFTFSDNYLFHHIEIIRLSDYNGGNHSIMFQGSDGNAMGWSQASGANFYITYSLSDGGSVSASITLYAFK